MKACNLWLSGVAGSCACVLAVTMHVLTLGVQCATHKAAFNLTVAGVHVQVMFGLGKSIAAQDPSYPVYVDTSVMMGNTGLHNGKGFDNIEYMVCTPENNFFPDLANVSAVHLEQLLPAQHTSQHWGQFCVCVPKTESVCVHWSLLVSTEACQPFRMPTQTHHSHKLVPKWITCTASAGNVQLVVVLAHWCAVLLCCRAADQAH